MSWNEVIQAKYYNKIKEESRYLNSDCLTVVLADYTKNEMYKAYLETDDSVHEKPLKTLYRAVGWDSQESIQK